MRPDPHKKQRRPKSAAAASKTQAPHNKKAKHRQHLEGLASNSSRYDDAEESHDPVGRGYSDLLAEASFQRALPTDVLSVKMPSHAVGLTLDVQSIVEALQCFTTSDLLRLPREVDRLVTTSQPPAVEDEAGRAMSRYLEDVMDPCYREECAPHPTDRATSVSEHIVYKNTGLRSYAPHHSMPAVTRDVTLDDDADTGKATITDAEDVVSTGKPDMDDEVDELEQWLDSVLD